MTSRRQRSARSGVAAVTLVAFVTSSLAPALAFAQAAPAEAPVYEVDPGAAGSQRTAEVPRDLERVRQLLEDAYAGRKPVEEGEGDPDEEVKVTPKKPGPGTAEQAAPATDLKSAPAPSSPAQAQGLPTGDRALVTGKSISVPKGEGTVEGMGESFSAQLSTGIATYSVPIAIPKARGDAQASLGLSYGSSGGFGVAGAGWSLPVPFIARQTDRGTPSYDDRDVWHPGQDRFVFNGGQELVPICVVQSGSCPGAITVPNSEEDFADENEAMPPWAEGHQYFRPRVEGSFLRFFWSPDHRTWRVQSKSGVTMELGVPLDGSGDRGALEENPDAASGREIYRWWLVRQYDQFGDMEATSGYPMPVNVVRYGYERRIEDGGAIYLTDVHHTPPVINAASAPVAEYAHHVHLQYEPRPDPSHSYRSGWRMAQTRRLARVDVASKPFLNPGGASRELVRRYHLAYDGSSHVSLLTSVEVEGRCASAVQEGTDQVLPSSSCPRLPPMTFDYSRVAGKLRDGTPAGTTIEGYEPVDARLHTIASSPEHSLDEGETILHDVDSDALPDVLVTSPGKFGGKHGVFFNGSSGPAGTFTASTIGVQGVLGANANTIALGNGNVVPLDVDGDATADLVHMPMVRKYAIYRAVKTGTQWWWQGREVETADQLNPKIDFGKDASFIRVVDVDFDGLVDVVRTTGTEVQTYFSLGRFPGGDGRFGQAAWTGAGTARLSTEPVRTCLPWSSTPISFGDKDITLADMNADGIVDIVRLRRGDIRYWPGRGNGYWGTGSRSGCDGGSFGQNNAVAMTASPYFSDIQADTLRLEDVNGDGLSDLVQVRFDDVDFWLNVDGLGFTHSHTIEETPPSPGYANRVRLTDVNGSGTPDILWGDAGRYRYVDLAGGTRPWLLTHVANGLGKTTDLEYQSSVAEMLAAKAAGAPWPRGMPIVSHVVKRVTVNDNITVAGRPPTADVTEYTYADPYYDGLQREFRGFRSATSRRVGDANSPADVTESRFLLGQCEDETEDSILECTPGQRWRDNPREALKGLPLVTERRTDSGVYHSTSFTQYRLARLYQGLDGREVRHAAATGESTILYDVAGFQPAATPLHVELLSTPGPDLEESLVLRSSGGTAFIEKSSSIDVYGNVDSVTEHGCVMGTECSQFTEEALTKESPTVVIDGDWLFRPVMQQVLGAWPDHLEPYGKTQFTYSSQGRLVSTAVWLDGTLELVRNSADTSYFPPRASSSGGWVESMGAEYDDFGNLTRDSGRNQRCRDVVYDTAYADAPVTEAVYTGKGLHNTSAAVFAGCGTGPLTTSAAYDRGLGVATLVTDVTGQPTKMVYDGFGRLTALHAPHATSLGTYSAVPTVRIDYTLPGPSNPTHSIVHVRKQDGSSQSSEAYLESWAYIDGLGRTFVTLLEAEYENAEAGGLGTIVSGLTRFDAKSAPAMKFIEHIKWGDGALDFKVAPATGYYDTPQDPFATQTYDAFGRPLVTTDYDGTVTLENTYRALSTDAWDAEDLKQGGDHAGTYVTELKDGHGRVVRTTERFGTAGADQRVTKIQYLPTGAPEVIRRYRASTPSVEQTRYMAYDSLGRLVLNVEPNTSTGYVLKPTPNLTAPNVSTFPTTLQGWRYRYNDAGDLVGMSDPRGCGVNYFYDGLGRLLMEDYFPCAAQHVGYGHPLFFAVSGLPHSNIEVAYEYDAVSAAWKPPGWTPPTNALKGRLVRVRDRGAHDLFWYDYRGNVLQNARQVAKPGIHANALMENRYTARWYWKTTSYDSANRPVTQSTGAASTIPELLGAGNVSTVTTSYNARGAVASVTSSYGPLIVSVEREPDGLVKRVEYGDAAATTTSYDFDQRRRVEEVGTERSAPGSWPSGWETDETHQLILENQFFTYDDVSNPLTIEDWRQESAWPVHAKPVDRVMTYDDFNRVKSIAYSYKNTDANNHDDPWESPFQDEVGAFSVPPTSSIEPQRAAPSPHISFVNRVRTQTFDYGWDGNTTNTTDDAKGFYDRSLGAIVNGTTNAGPHQIKTAEILPAASSRSGKATATYDLAGNMLRLDVNRNGPCLATSTGATPGCALIFKYEWDEKNRLTRARRWDFVSLTPPPATPNNAETMDLRYRYDADDNRVIKSAKQLSNSVERHTVYVFDSLELRRAAYGTPTANEYDLNMNTEVPYLFANGARLGRVVYEPTTPLSSPSAQHVFLELGDHLGSTSTVLDKATGELVEKSTYQAYGAAESDFRPEQWKEFREDYRFTGKEEDVEVGLVYFGKRFYSAQLNRWMSPDPLGIDSPLETDLNLYAYVEGRALVNVDPRGLRSCEGAGGCGGEDHGGQGGSQGAPGSEQQKPNEAYESGYQDGLHNRGVDAEADQRQADAEARRWRRCSNCSEEPEAWEAQEKESQEIEEWRKAKRLPEPEGGKERDGYNQGYRDHDKLEEAAWAMVPAPGGKAKGGKGGAPVAGTGKAAGRVFPAKVDPKTPGPPRVLSTKPVKKSDATKEAGRGGKHGGVVGPKTQAKKMGGPQDSPHREGGLPHTHAPSRKPRGHFWYPE